MPQPNQKSMNIVFNTPSGTYAFTLHVAETQFHRLSGLYSFLIIPPQSPQLLAGTSETNTLESKLSHSTPVILNLFQDHNHGNPKHLNPPLNQTWLSEP